jgi:hypothetical protein
LKLLLVLILSFGFSHHALAGDIKWEGTYRFEGVKVFNPSLQDGGNNKAYFLHHLMLRPQFQAYDGLTIHSRFDILNSSGFPNDQLGQVFGAGVNSNVGTPGVNNQTNASNSNTISGQQGFGGLAVNELYANWVHEFGVLTVGRAPMHFGLGMNFNGGFGVFDHWLENRDLIAYKVVFGNISVMPVIAKSYEGDLGQEDDVNDYILQLEYSNPETDLEVGLIYQARRSTSQPNSNDTPTPPFGATAAQTSNYEVDSYNVFLSQWVDSVKVAFEVGFMSGSTGLSVNGAEIQHDALGGALELIYHPEASNWGFNLDMGYASGDDPTTANTFEGYIFDRNYDVAFLLFNHPMGTQDFFRTSYLNNISATGAAVIPDPTNSFDTEAISNTIYASFATHYKWADEKFDFESRLTYAQLAQDPFNSGVDSNVGFEVDLSLKYEPFKGFQWINRAGIFLPGAAFEGGTNNFPVNNAYGFETKAAISF